MSQKFKIPISIIELDSRSYHLLIEVYINKLPVNVIIDTGASRTVFDKSLLGNKLQIVKHSNLEEIQSAGIIAGNIESDYAIAESFKIGKLKLRDFPVVLIDMNGINQLYKKVTGKEVHGLLGSDFLLDFKAVINYGKASLVLKTHE
jgi:hypothetical protein